MHIHQTAAHANLKAVINIFYNSYELDVINIIILFKNK